MPSEGQSIRICLAYKNDENSRSNNNWAQVSFFMPAWGEADWYVYYQKPGNLNENFCASGMSNDKLTDDVWEVKKNYWSNAERRLLLDVERPMEFDDDNEQGAVTMDFDSDLQSIITFGVWDNKDHRDDGRIKGQKNLDGIQRFKVYQGASGLFMGLATAAATALYAF